MNGHLPQNVHMLTMEQWDGDTFLLRLEHFYEKGEHPVLSKTAIVDLKVRIICGKKFYTHQIHSTKYTCIISI